jgi:hypothetical protein
MFKRREKMRVGYYTMFKTQDEKQYYGRLYVGGILFDADCLRQAIAGKTSLVSIINDLADRMSVVFAPHVTIMRKVVPPRRLTRRAKREPADQMSVLRLA